MPQNSSKSTHRLLHDHWRFQEVKTNRSSPAASLPWLPAHVPGHVHLDLIRAGVIQDPFYRLGERGAIWVDHTDWVYETAFHVDAPPAANAFLRFNGLDTVAEIVLNGEPLGQTDNMFIPHEFPVGGKLREGENTLQVTFRSALKTGWDRQQAWDEAGNDTMEGDWFSWNTRSFVRKAQYMYGWDWGPEPVSCGIWRPIELVTIPVARLLDWRYECEFTPEGPALVRIEAFVERAKGQEEAPLTLNAAIPETFRRDEGVHPVEVAPASVEVPAGEGRLGVTLTLRIEDPQRWTPVGRGEPEEWNYPTLYRLMLSLQADGEEVDGLRGRIGLRTVEFVQEPDEDGQGESFQFRVNGENLYIKGANWIPVNSFPSHGPYGTEIHDSEAAPTARGRQDRIKALLEAAHAAEMNMLRVWGGGLYESEHFYHLCDEMGILVWQDFLFACAMYPEEE
ncbi:MAG: hypothetical protein KY468_18725, partial [Armatimonadetes bacterium]|nr:hypothetical protein [Armatimonadota bacterium]